MGDRTNSEPIQPVLLHQVISRLPGWRRSKVVLGVLVVFGVAACGDSDPTDPETTVTDSTIIPITGQWYRPAVTATWQWQLLGTVNTQYDVDVYDIDLFDVPATQIASLQAAGKRVICYFSAGSFEDFRSDAASFRSQELGNVFDDFPNERWLDIRSPNVLAIMESRLDMAVDKGCDGVEPDNVDGFANNTGFNLTSADQLTFNRTIANEAHERGLSVGLKNDLDQIANLIRFAVEQCGMTIGKPDEQRADVSFIVNSQHIGKQHGSAIIGLQPADTRPSGVTARSRSKAPTPTGPLGAALSTERTTGRWGGGGSGFRIQAARPPTIAVPTARVSAQGSNRRGSIAGGPSDASSASGEASSSSISMRASAMS